MPAITKEEIIAIAVTELSQKTLGYTQQFLDIHRVAIQDGIPTIEHVRILEDGIAVVYFKVHDEQFFFAISVDMGKKEVRWSYSESFVQVSFVAESTDLTYDALSALTKLKPNWGWDKDPQAKYRGKRVTKIAFQPYKDPDNLEINCVTFWITWILIKRVSVICLIMPRMLILSQQQMFTISILTSEAYT